MIRLIKFTKPLNEYDDFTLCHSSKNDSWALIGEWNAGTDINHMNYTHMHYIAISDNEEELRMWIDLRNIHIKEVIKCKCWSVKSMCKHIKIEKDEDEFKKHRNS